jgi:starch-binding outer membrane protein, SusD/RagB family
MWQPPCSTQNHVSKRLTLIRAMVCSALLSVACNDITRVEDNGVLQPINAQNPSGAAALRAGAISEMAVGLSLQMIESGLLVDEFKTISSSLASTFPEDQRDLTQLNSTNYPYGALSTARINALIAIENVERYLPTQRDQVAELFTYVAATELVFAENMCSGIPVADVNGFTASYGPALTRDSLISRALGDLDSANAYATPGDSVSLLATVLQGRAYLDDGNLTQASASVTAVPTTFAYATSSFLASVPNQLYYYIEQYQRITISNAEGENGLPFVSAADPRVVTSTSIVGGDSLTTLASLSATTPLTVASGIEARLITAEAALQAGDVATWRATLNMLRQTAISPAMDTLTSDSTTNAGSAFQLQVMFRERAFWLFGTGHRHGDLRRLIRQYSLPIESVFPTGPYEGGPQQYGISAVFYPGGEQSNPNFTGCIDVNP